MGFPGKSSGRKADPAKDPNVIKVRDEYGRELQITKEQWRDNVLLGNLDKARNDPDQLYGMLSAALEDGFAQDIIPYAEHLHRTDPTPSRGAVLLGVVYMEVGRLADAQRVLEQFLSAHEEDGYVLTNLAKVHSRLGDERRAEEMLWHALEVDPNQENGFGWYVAIQRDRGGDQEAHEAFRRVASLPRSWRARLWLARTELEAGNLSAALALYSEALEVAEPPVPGELLVQMSGDLGNNGRLKEAIELTAPQFDPAVHGLMVGNNLIKANLDLGRLQEARRILDQLYAQKRSDWGQTLGFWDTELAKARLESQPAPHSEQLSASLISIEGPLWTRDGSPFKALLAVKPSGAPRIAVLGSTALTSEGSEELVWQLADTPGRISRGVPLLLTEHIHMTTEGVAQTLVPMVNDAGFTLFGHEYGDDDLCELVRKSQEPIAFIVYVVLDTTGRRWKIDLRALRTRDRRLLGETSVAVDAQAPGAAAYDLAKSIGKMLLRKAEIRATTPPSWYAVPTEPYASDYLLRLEQALTVMCAALESARGEGVFGHREIIAGIVQMCVNQPANATVRMVLFQTLRQMKKVRPEVVSEYKANVGRLQSSYPLSGDVGKMVDSAVAEVFAD